MNYNTIIVKCVKQRNYYEVFKFQAPTIITESF